MDRQERRNFLINNKELINELITSYEEDGEQITIDEAMEIIENEFDLGEIH